METVLIADDEKNIREGLNVFLTGNPLAFTSVEKPATEKMLSPASFRITPVSFFLISVCPN